MEAYGCWVDVFVNNDLANKIIQFLRLFEDGPKMQTTIFFPGRSEKQACRECKSLSPSLGRVHACGINIPESGLGL